MSIPIHYDSPKEIRQLLASANLQMNRRFGQNFLISRGGRERIIEQVHTQGASVYWEVGPGIGSLTHLATAFTPELVLFEIDRGFASILRRQFGELEHVTLIEGDVLKTWPLRFSEAGIPDVIFGNLPYNIGAQTIASFIEQGCLADTMVFTLQKEVVQRMCAAPGTKQYSSFSVLCSLDYRIEHLFDLHPGAFYPAPDVDSAVVKLVRRDSSICAPLERRALIAFIHTLFGSRRKTVVNNIRQGYPQAVHTAAVLEGLGLDPSVRAERLSALQIYRLFRAMTDQVAD